LIGIYSLRSSPNSDINKPSLVKTCKGCLGRYSSRCLTYGKDGYTKATIKKTSAKAEIEPMNERKRKFLNDENIYSKSGVM